MSKQEIRVPDLGGSDEVEIIEIHVSAGDKVAEEDPILEVESDKAATELPSPGAGTITEITAKVGDKVKEGDVIGTLETADDAGSDDEEPDDEGAEDSAATESTDKAETSADTESGEEAADEDGKGSDTDDKTGQERLETVHVPDLGGAENVPVIEIQVRAGDTVATDDPLVTVESDKASMEIPSPFAGTVESVNVKDGDTVSEGDQLLQLRVRSEPDKAPASDAKADSGEPAKKEKPPEKKAEPTPSGKQEQAPPEDSTQSPGSRVHAGPAVRKLAREFGVDLANVRGSGPSRRILKDDVQAYVKGQLQGGGGAVATGGGSGIPGVKLPDFSQFGEVERQPLSGIAKATADSMQRSWLNVPHVTQFDEADITEMESFRQSLKGEGEKRGVKVTPMAFLLKATAYALQHYPAFNVSLDMAKQEKVLKHYIHIGIAVDTPAGLVVPVIRNADKKGIWELAEEAQVLAEKARNKKLTRDDMSGASFTITSLGGIGGTAFTPIVNTPEVAILGVSRSAMKPVWNGNDFEPRLMLPLSLSYDHRAVNGAEAARFTTFLAAILGDMRRMLM